jgi:hypothetical protein
VDRAHHVGEPVDADSPPVRAAGYLAAVALHVAYYNFCRVHESMRTTPAVALGIADRVWGAR